MEVAWYRLVWAYSLAKDIPLHTVPQCLPCTVHGMSMVNSLWVTHIRPPPRHTLSPHVAKMQHRPKGVQKSSRKKCTLLSWV